VQDVKVSQKEDLKVSQCERQGHRSHKIFCAGLQLSFVARD